MKSLVGNRFEDQKLFYRKLGLTRKEYDAFVKMARASYQINKQRYDDFIKIHHRFIKEGIPSRSQVGDEAYWNAIESSTITITFEIGVIDDDGTKNKCYLRTSTYCSGAVDPKNFDPEYLEITKVWFDNDFGDG